MDGVSHFKVTPMLDSRGSFSKVTSAQDLKGIGNFNLEEIFITKSSIGVVRGIHLQVGPAANHRIIHVLKGSAFDVLFDLRPKSQTFGHIQQLTLSADSPSALVVPPGVAHGFQALEELEMLYVTNKGWNPTFDTGINPLKSGISWPIDITEVSPRDQTLPTFASFKGIKQ
jgi:dTDP-4-dehydrorhamnose 3,5-epimerase